MTARFASSTTYKSVTDPEALLATPIPPCEDKYYIHKPCFDFVWSGNGSARVRSIAAAAAILANNPGRPIPSTKAMTMMGLYDSAYWFSWLTWEGIITLLSSPFITLFGMIFQFDTLLKNNFAVIFLVFFLFQLNMIGFAFMLSAFISKSSSSTTVGFSIFIVGSITQIVTTAGFPYSDNISKRYRIIWSFFPPNLLAKGLEILSSATSPPHDMGIKWSGITNCPPGETDCVITMALTFSNGWRQATFFLWFILAIYFDNIIPNVAGVRKSALYFLNPGYGIGKSGKVKEGGICSCIGSVPEHESLTPDDEDVLEEESIVKQQKGEGVVDPNIAVQIHGLSKSYPGTTKIGCCRCKRASSYHALKGVYG